MGQKIVITNRCKWLLVTTNKSHLSQNLYMNRIGIILCARISLNPLPRTRSKHFPLMYCRYLRWTEALSFYLTKWAEWSLGCEGTAGYWVPSKQKFIEYRFPKNTRVALSNKSLFKREMFMGNYYDLEA